MTLVDVLLHVVGIRRRAAAAVVHADGDADLRAQLGHGIDLGLRDLSAVLVLKRLWPESQTYMFSIFGQSYVSSYGLPTPIAWLIPSSA